MNRGRPVGGGNGDGPFRPVSVATSPVAHPRRSPRSLSVKSGSSVVNLCWSNWTTSLSTSSAQRWRCSMYSFWETKSLRRPRMPRSGRAATKVPEPRMEHGLNTERESALMALEKEEITEKISSQLHLKGLFWESVFHPCSIRGSPENLVGNERFLLIVVQMGEVLRGQDQSTAGQRQEFPPSCDSCPIRGIRAIRGPTPLRFTDVLNSILTVDRQNGMVRQLPGRFRLAERL